MVLLRLYASGMPGDVEFVLQARSDDGAGLGEIHDFGHAVLRDRYKAADTLGSAHAASGSFTVQTDPC